MLFYVNVLRPTDLRGFRNIGQHRTSIDYLPLIVYNEIQSMYTKCKGGTIWLREMKIPL